MNIGPIIAIPPLPEGTPQGNATSVPPNPASPAVPQVAAIPAAEGARTVDKERHRNERPDDELNPRHSDLGPLSGDERTSPHPRVDAEPPPNPGASARSGPTSRLQAEAAALAEIAAIAREVRAPPDEDHGHDDPCGTCSRAISAYLRGTSEALDRVDASARPIVEVDY